MGEADGLEAVGTTVGVVGAGVMGSAMATRLVAARHPVVAWDLDQRRLDGLADRGVQTATGMDALLERAEVVILSLPGPGQVTEVVTGAGGLLSLAGDIVILDTSTVDPLTSRAMAGAAAERSATYLAAPVIGGEPAANDGSLTIIVGGARDGYVRARHVLEVLGGDISHVDEVGAATTLKLVNNLMSLTNTVTMMEALALAARAGVAPSLVYQTLRTGSGYSAAFERRWLKHLSRRDFAAGFSVDLAVKDLSLVEELGANLAVPLFSSSLALQMYRVLGLSGMGSEDVSVLARWWEQILDTRLDT